MSNYRYILEPYKGKNSRFKCPACKNSASFVRYVDSLNGSYINSDVGKCNREINCSYHYTPKQYLHDHNLNEVAPATPERKNSEKKETTFIPFEIFNGSLAKYEENNLISFLKNVFGFDVTAELVSRYFIGTSKHWPNSTVFWQIDQHGKIRTGKIMLYNTNSGKRVKEPYNHIAWAHKLLKRPEFNLEQCLFGEHLLRESRKPVAIVESEKTAIISSVYFPEFIWLAAGSLNNLAGKKLRCLEGRFVTLFPDLNCYERWTEKARELSGLARINVSDLLERKSTDQEKKGGLDIADYLLRFDYRSFRTHTISKTPIKSQSNIANDDNTWGKSILEIENFFKLYGIPEGKIRLNKWTTISDTKKFVESSLACVNAHKGNPAYLPYLQSLQEFRTFLMN